MRSARACRRPGSLEKLHQCLGQLARTSIGRGRDKKARAAIAQAPHDFGGAGLGFFIGQQITLVQYQPARLAREGRIELLQLAHDRTRVAHRVGRGIRW